MAGLQRTWPMIAGLLSLGFNLERTPRAGTSTIGSPIAGKVVVFTGTMASGDRSTMEDAARKLGATVGGSVTGKTDLLVCGAKVGVAKTERAAALNVRVISEQDYLALIGAA